MAGEIGEGVLCTDDRCFTDPRVISSRLVTHSSPSHEEMLLHESEKGLLRTKLRGSVLFVARPLLWETPPLKQSTCATKQAYYKIFVLKSPKMLSLYDHRLGITESAQSYCLNNHDMKIKKFATSSAPIDNSIMFVNSLHWSGPFVKCWKITFVVSSL